MKVIAIVTDAFGGHGGISQYNRDFLLGLDAMSCVTSVLVIPRLGDRLKQVVSSKICQLPSCSNRLLYSLRCFWAALRTRPDVIFSGHVYHGPLALLLAKIFRCRLISQLHGDEIWVPLATRLLRPLKASDLVLCVSSHTKAQYEEQAPGTVNSAVLHNTVGNAFVAGDRQAARARYEVGDAFVLLTVARIDGRNGYKGHDIVLKAMAKLLTTDGRPILYLVAGDGEDRPRLERLTAELELGSRVRFMGKVPDPDLPDLYRAADFFVMPSTGEGFGIVFIEAMACGTPALGLAIGGAPEALCDGELGRAVTMDKFASALADGIAEGEVNRARLSALTRSRFGQESFRKRLTDLIAPLEHKMALKAS